MVKVQNISNLDQVQNLFLDLIQIEKHIPVWVYLCDGHWEISIPFITWSTLTISEWAVGFRYGNFTLKLALGKKSLASRGPTALGRQAFFFPWANFWRWRNFHTWNSAHLEILYFPLMHTWFDAQLDQKILDGIYSFCMWCMKNQF